ncbi:hypothetical protein QZH41_009697, partial [Actinostola sp. cb2023]
KLNVKVVTPSYNEGVMSTEEAMHISKAQEENKTLLSIPRRPPWTTTMAAQELDLQERDSFIEWRRQLANLQDKDHIILTPFEKNIEFWRQLWRVIERSDVIVQIVDARHPLLFRCEDLEAYIKEVNPQKENLLLINKADYLTPTQRLVCEKKLKQENDITNESEEAENQAENQADQDNPEDEDDEDQGVNESEEKDSIAVTSRFAELSTEELETKESGDVLESEDTTIHSTQEIQVCNEEHEAVATVKSYVPHNDSNSVTETDDTEDVTENSKQNEIEGKSENTLSSNDKESDVNWNELLSFMDCSGKLLSSEELIEFCRYLHHRSAGNDTGEDGSKLTTIGMVGYPNVGKSSTINAILQHKKVPVSATPGRTKHFQ